MKTLRVDEKWSIDYSPRNNDRPMNWRRYGELHSDWNESNAVTSLFYAFLEKQNNANS